MKKSFLVINRIMLLSLKEQKAKQVIFDRHRTIITSKDTDAGKSSLVKSIYYTFGCTVKFNPTWVSSEFVSFIDFEVKGNKYSILRDRNAIAIFQDSQMIKLFEYDEKGISQYLGQLLNFDMQFQDKQEEYATPPIHFFFSLFYLDQDMSQDKTWNSFIHDRKSYMRNITDEIILFHSGKRNNEYYRLQGKRLQLTQEVNKTHHEIIVLRRIKDKTESNINKYEFISRQLFEKEIPKLLEQTNVLSTKRNKIKNELHDFNNQHIHLVHQITVATSALKDLDKDYQFALKLNEGELICPLCGTKHQNSFPNRFAIVRNKFECEQILSELYDEDDKVRLDIKKLQNEYEYLDTDYQEINRILNIQKEQLRLKDLIDSKGQEFLSQAFSNEIEDLEEIRAIDARKLHLIKESQKELIRDSSDQTNQIDTFYLSTIGRFLSKLDARMAENKYRSMKIRNIDKGTGSTGFRGLFAHFYAMLQVSYKYSDSIFCPIVIDTLNQSGQSHTKLDKISELIDNAQPIGSQLIIAIGDLAMNASRLKGKIVELNHTNSLLQEEYFEEIHTELKPYFIQMTNSRKRTLF